MLEVIKRPLVTEKLAGLAEDVRTYAFEVDRKATKPEIKKAIETGFGVKVESVRTLNTEYAKFGPPQYTKKALVRLKAGETISIFEGA
jgi:large subunit ribosomal protein L23